MLGQQYPDVPYIGPPNVYRKDEQGNPRTSRKRWAVAHSTENDATDTGEAGYARRRTDASSHYYVDRDSLTQSLHTAYQAGHVGSITGNTYGIAYEFVGFKSWSRERWLTSIRWDLAGRQLARDSIEHGFPLDVLTQDELEAGEHGVITHDMARLAWGGTDHTDPGPGFPMDHWVAIARNYLEDPDMRFYLVKADAHPRPVYVYTGGQRVHVPDGATLSALLTKTGQKVIELDDRKQLDLLAPVPVPPPAPVISVTDEQLARVLRGVIFPGA